MTWLFDLVCLLLLCGLLGGFLSISDGGWSFVCLSLSLVQHLPGESELVDPRLVHTVDVPLVEEYEEYNVVPEASYAVHGWHLDDKGEDVVDERVQGLRPEKN